MYRDLGLFPVTARLFNMHCHHILMFKKKKKKKLKGMTMYQALILFAQNKIDFTELVMEKSLINNLMTMFPKNVDTEKHK